MRIGELLLLRESIDAIVLLQAVRGQQGPAGHRLVSTLILRAHLEPDEGALALSEQTGFPAALQRHLETRDIGVEHLVPRELARAWVVVPIGRAQDGALVVVARDPTAILAAAVAHATKQRITLAVAPAIHVERLVRAVYGAPGPVDAPLPDAPPSIADVGSGPIELAPAGPGTPRRSRTISSMPFADARKPAPSPLEITLQEMDQAFSLVAIERMALAYFAERWPAALLVRIAGQHAIGIGGHGEHLGVIDAITLPLTAPSLISVAVETRHATADAPASAVQTHLLSLLGDPRRAIAAPVESQGQVVAVIVIADRAEHFDRGSVVELGRLADALAAAYTRFALGQRPSPRS